MGPQDFCAKTCHEIRVLSQSCQMSGHSGTTEHHLPHQSCGQTPAGPAGVQLCCCSSMLSMCWPLLAVRYSQPLVEPHFTCQGHRHPVDESFGLFRHIGLGAGHLQLNGTPTDVLRERR